MGKDASTIKQEIEATRERMGDTVEALGYKADVGARVKDNVQDRLDSVKGAIGDVVENVKTAVNGTTDAVSGAVADRTRDGADSVSATVSKLNDRVGQLNDGLTDKLQSVDVGGQAQRVVGIAKENPIGLSLVGLALGFLAGSVIPVSTVEQQRLGPIRDKVVDQAQAATHDLVEAGKAVVAETAQSVVTTALSSAQTHGHEVIDNAKARADQA